MDHFGTRLGSASIDPEPTSEAKPWCQLPELLVGEGFGAVGLRMRQVGGKILRRAVHQAVGKAGRKVVAGVLRAQQPLAHGQGL